MLTDLLGPNTGKTINMATQHSDKSKQSHGNTQQAISPVKDVP